MVGSPGAATSIPWGPLTNRHLNPGVVGRGVHGDAASWERDATRDLIPGSLEGSSLNGERSPVALSAKAKGQAVRECTCEPRVRVCVRARIALARSDAPVMALFGGSDARAIGARVAEVEAPSARVCEDSRPTFVWSVGGDNGKRTDGRTNRRADRRTYGQNEPWTDGMADSKMYRMTH
ncbi:unnamed protein product [Lampetra planeri]